MRIQLTQEEFECLWKNCDSFRTRIYRTLEGQDITATEPLTHEQLAKSVKDQFKATNQKIPAIKYVRKFVQENRDFPVHFDVGAERFDILSLLGAKKFVEEFCGM